MSRVANFIESSVEHEEGDEVLIAGNVWVLCGRPVNWYECVGPHLTSPGLTANKPTTATRSRIAAVRHDSSGGLHTGNTTSKASEHSICRSRRGVPQPPSIAWQRWQGA